MLLITIGGATEEQTTDAYDAIGELCLANGAQEVFVADNHTTSERIWGVRRNIAEAFGVMSTHQINEDLVVPPARIADLVAAMEKLGEKHGVLFPAYGHAGDGNLHVRIIKPDDWSVEQWETRSQAAQQDLYEETAKLGGMLSGEHGVGHKRKAYMETFVDENYLNVLRAIKRALDPNLILNPGKIFDM
jgi:glycolate oxidase